MSIPALCSAGSDRSQVRKAGVAVDALANQEWSGVRVSALERRGIAVDLRHLGAGATNTHHDMDGERAVRCGIQSVSGGQHETKKYGLGLPNCNENPAR